MSRNTETHFWVCNKSDEIITINELDVIQLCFGEEHALLLTKDGKVYSFGMSSFGQLGNGSHNEEFSQTLFQVKEYEVEREDDRFPLPKISKIACGPFTSAVVSEDGRLFMWGDNRNGQCGPFSNEILLRPKHVSVKEEVTECLYCNKELSSFVNFVQVSCGTIHTIGLSSHYELWSWGAVGSEQLGTKSIPRDNGSQQHPTRIEFLSGFRVVDISCGYDHNLALVESEQDERGNHYCVYCSKVRFGNKKKLNSLNRSSPKSTCPLGLPVRDSSSSSDFSSRKSQSPNIMISNHDNGIVLNDSIDLCSNEDNSTENCDNVSHLSQFVNRISSAVKLYNRKDTSTNSDINEFEVLSEVSSDELDNNKVINENLLCEIEGYENSFWAFRRTDSFKSLAELKCRYSVQSVKSRRLSGLSSTSTDYSRSRLSINEENISQKISNEAWQKSTRFEVWSWGCGDKGQLGHGDRLGRNHPCRIKDLSGHQIQRVFAGNAFSFALTASGVVFSWGDNGYGQLGHTDMSNVLVPKQLVFQSQSTCWDLSVGSHHCLILADLHFPSVALYYLGKHEKTELCSAKGCLACASAKRSPSSPMKQLNIFERSLLMRNVYSGGPFSGSVTFKNEPKHGVPNHHIFAACERHFHRCLRLIMRKVFHPLLNDTHFTKETSSNILHPLSSLIALWTKLKDLVSQNAYDSRLLLQERCQIASLNMIENYSEWIEIYKELIDSISNVIAVNGIAGCMKFMCLSPNIVQSIAAEIYGVKTTKKKSAQELLYILLSIPTKRINEYISFMERYSMKSNTENGSNFIPQCVLNDWKLIKDYSANELKKAQQTRDFWNSSSKKLVDFYCIPSRRLVKDHKSEPLSLISTTLPTSSSLLTSPSFTLFNDVFVYYFGQFVTIPLETIWIDSNDDTLPDCHFRLILPEDKITFSTSSPESRTLWISTFNQSIKSAMERQKLCDIILVMKKSCRQESGASMFPPATRNAFYQFKRHSVYKDATYYGGWLNAKLHGDGEILWSDGRIFNGKFQDNVQNGEGVYKIVESEGDTIYKGMWVNGLMKGFGYIKYWNGDTYRGYFANNERNGFGILKCGCFLSDAASVYVGEWQNNKRHGYGVLDDIMSREIYLGSWKDDVRHGNGVVVNIDGIYYEGSFVNDVLTGPGLLIYDDGTEFDGELGPGGLLKGKGIMKFPNGDVIEGIFDGFWREDVKINGVLRKMSPHTDTIDSNKHCDRLSKIGVHAIAAKEKWKCVFDECKQLLKFDSGNNNAAWETIAVSVHKKRTEICRRSSKRFTMDPSLLSSLERIPRNAEKSDKELTVDDYYRIKEYLLTACSCEFHPLGTLISTLLDVYRTSYLGKGANVRLLPHAVSEIKSFLQRVYEIVRFLFPDLPAFNSPLTIEFNEDATAGSRVCRQSSLIIGDLISNEDGQHCLTVTPSTLLHPILLPPLHPALFTLYGLKCEKEDIQYWDRLLRWNKQSDIALMSFLGVDENLYLLRSEGDTSPLLRPSTQRVHRLQRPSETLQRIRTATTPVDKLLVVKETVDEIKSEFPEDFMWGMDHLFPVFLFVVIRAKIKNLGADIHFIQDLMDSHFENGELGYMFTTLKASYYQIITEKLYNL